MWLEPLRANPPIILKVKVDPSGALRVRALLPLRLMPPAKVKT
jgi:hypothetical protein